MKNWFQICFAGLALIYLTTAFQGCYDPCKGVICVNGDCIEGTCKCDPGYEGKDCSKAFNAKISGIYDLHELCWPSGEFDDFVSITPVAGTQDRFIYTGMWGDHTTDILCLIQEDGSHFTFEETYLETADRNCESVWGEISDNGRQIDLIYRIYVVGDSVWDDSCTTVLTK